MRLGSHARPSGERRPWRVATPVLAIACGSLFAVSAVNAQDGDLRPERYVDLAALVANQNRDVQQLQERVGLLNAEVNRLTSDVVNGEVRRLQKRADRTKASAGLTEVEGPGLTVTLSDAPAEVINDSPYNPNFHVVHQQDISAVVNAMWAAGAEAVTIQGQRVVTTTGIKCNGNAVRLQGLAYAEPYVVSAVGDVDDLEAALDASSAVDAYRELAANPAIAVGWDVQEEAEVTAPAYDGPTATTYARVIRETG